MLATFDETARHSGRIRQFESRVLARTQHKPLFRTAGLTLEEQIEAEDRHVAASVEYAARVLGLGTPGATSAG